MEQMGSSLNYVEGRRTSRPPEPWLFYPEVLYVHGGGRFLHYNVFGTPPFRLLLKNRLLYLYRL